LLAVLLGAFGDGVLGGVGIGFRFGELFVADFVEGGAEADVDGEALTGATFIYAANRRDIAVVAAVGYANVAKLDRLA
jgi:hypothetical protein